MVRLWDETQGARIYRTDWSAVDTSAARVVAWIDGVWYESRPVVRVAKRTRPALRAELKHGQPQVYVFESH